MNGVWNGGKIQILTYLSDLMNSVLTKEHDEIKVVHVMCFFFFNS